MAICLQCGNEFGAGQCPSAIKARKYCSRTCMFDYFRAHPELRGAKPVYLTCSYCGRDYTRTLSRVRGKAGDYCSIQCSQLARSPFLRTHPDILKKDGKLTKICERCGAEYTCKPSHYDRRRYCSEDCGRRAHKLKMRGEGNANYRHGQNQAAAKHLALRTFPIECIVCGWSISVDVHHVEPKRDGGRNHITNLAVLCPNHHRMADLGLLTQAELLQTISDRLAALQPGYQESNQMVARQ